MGTAGQNKYSLCAAWDENAGDWVRWARSRECDHAFWHLNLPALLALLPRPGEITLDVGCGEGRLARALKELGHHVVGVESSRALARAAREADQSFEVHVVDAVAMSLPDNHVDLAIASLALMNMDDMPGVVGEIARVLQPGGRFCFSVLHPVNSWGDAGAGYFETVRYTEELRDNYAITANKARMTLHDTHRSLGDYFGALYDAGFLVERVVEPVPDDAYIAAFPQAARWRERPGFLHVRALLGR
jgi:ubiquinone/menaquinone biosynthesis C-methylase UbiE